ncbi:MAG: sulfatase-like hydrolase/transferase [Armatimonadetes bacterium]|nr:sulfatase-like hydrolase/transferase [Armatimonadota bacterium]HOM81114.1 sulfatase-like hydrolase/transferase [Armatimonadota bacterium]HPO71331.1 sulfatase-like hydrolase/transferase [Armatimonadota bacterium]
MNILVIAIDTLRADHLGCYGYPLPTSPHIDRLAREGVVFQCFSPHIPTHPGYTTLFTGKDVMAHQIVCQGGKVELDPKVRLLAEILRENGYFTAAADNLGRWFPRGFDLYEGYQWDQDPKGAWRKGEAVNKTAQRILDECVRQPKPWFAFLHYWDPHTPYLPPVPFDRMFYHGNERAPENHSMDAVFAFEPFRYYFMQWMGGVTDIEFPKRQYDAAIAYADVCLQHLFTQLAALGALEETVVVITADHGEEMDEHEMWFDHHGLYDTNLRVPLIMRCPDRLPRGKYVDGMVTLMDVAPTLLALAGLEEAAAKEGMLGKNLLPLVRDEVAPGQGSTERIFLTENTWMRKRGVRTREWKLIRACEPDIHNRPPIELYHLPTDPGEQYNLAQERPEVVAELSNALDEWIERRKRETGLPDPIETQGITLRSVGKVATAVPEDQRL